jgi:hypothetical protein
MSDIEIIDNFLPQEEWQQINDLFFVNQAPKFWQYVPRINNESDPAENFQFCHYVYHQSIPLSEYFDRIHFLFAPRLNVRTWSRIKFNLITRSQENTLHGWHTDEIRGVDNVAIYYINTTNGNTVFKNGKEVDCVANRLVKFPGHLEHSSKNQTDENARIVLNFNWF